MRKTIQDIEWVLSITKEQESMKQYREQAKIARALGHPMRLQILEVLASSPACVCELTAITGRRQACVSQHLMLLRQAGLVKRTRMGWRNMRYEIANESTKNILRCILQYSHAGRSIREETGDVEHVTN